MPIPRRMCAPSHPTFSVASPLRRCVALTNPPPISKMSQNVSSHAFHLTKRTHGQTAKPPPRSSDADIRPLARKSKPASNPFKAKPPPSSSFLVSTPRSLHCFHPATSHRRLSALLQVPLPPRPITLLQGLPVAPGSGARPHKPIGLSSRTQAAHAKRTELGLTNLTRVPTVLSDGYGFDPDAIAIKPFGFELGRNVVRFTVRANAGEAGVRYT